MSQSVFAITMFASYLLGTYIIFWYGHKMFEYKRNAKYSFCISLIANIILWILLIMFNTPLINIIGTIVIYFFVMLTAYNCDWKLSIFHSLLLLAIMNISEFIVLFFVSGLFNLEVNHYENSLIIFVEETFASKFIFFTLLAIISSFSKKTRNKDGLMSSILLAILPATTFFITMVFRYQNMYYISNTNTNILFVFSEIFLFLAIIVVFFIHERTIENQKKLHDMEMVEQKQAINLEYLDILEKKDEETRIFVHDIKNNLINISNLTDEENVKKYIQEIYNKSNEISVKAKTKNRLLDVIINKYYLLCKDKNIDAVHLYTVHSNTIAVNMYKSIGFIEWETDNEARKDDMHLIYYIGGKV